MHGLTQRIERVAKDSGEPCFAMGSTFVKLTHGWSVKLPCAVIAGITMYHLGLVESLVNWLTARGVEFPQLGLILAYALLLAADITTGAGGAIMRDIKAGVLSNAKKREFSSRRFGLGLWKGVAHISLLAGTIVAADATPEMLGWLPETTFVFLALTILLSVIENLQKAGVGGPMLGILSSMLSKGGVGKKGQK